MKKKKFIFFFRKIFYFYFNVNNKNLIKVRENKVKNNIWCRVN
jgi:hypothetical protein